VVVAFRRRKYRDRALLWLALVTLANPWADPLIQTLLAARVVRAIRLRRELAEAVGREVFSGRGLRFVTAVSAIGLFGLGWLFSAVETTQHLTVGDGVWFALVTAATVGYGDIVPTTSGGRFIAAALMILGLFVVGLLTGAVAERFTRNKPGGEDVARRLDELATRLERIESNLGGTGGRD
jgi:voltage-gated potassium channel